jgi:hypothetical protein
MLQLTPFQTNIVDCAHGARAGETVLLVNAPREPDERVRRRGVTTALLHALVTSTWAEAVIIGDSSFASHRDAALFKDMVPARDLLRADGKVVTRTGAGGATHTVRFTGLSDYTERAGRRPLGIQGSTFYVFDGAAAHYVMHRHWVMHRHLTVLDDVLRVVAYAQSACMIAFTTPHVLDAGAWARLFAADAPWTAVDLNDARPRVGRDDATPAN